ncbi:alpha/beta fold hydrolase [Rhodosalinus sp.]|uniref:alpha/beta fold hydrolase n=1 Tax=Rhodosalinus sp. TaxID=2047741 RepID=UPI0035630D26
MAEFLLIHGSCHGAWCWRDLIPALEARGHAARAIDLPGHGEDATPAGEVTLEAYAEAILGAIADPVVLVGHSMAGFPITAAAEKAPEKIARLVYLCAYVPAGGVSLVEMRQAAPRQPLLPALEKSADGLSFTARPEMAPGVFYHDCPEETVDWAVPRLCPQPVAPQATPLDVTQRSRALPRDYILCTDDRTIPPEYQATMTADWPAGAVHEMATGHSPFFADPEGLARLLDCIAEGS